MAPLRKQARLKVQTRDDSGRLGGYLAELMGLEGGGVGGGVAARCRFTFCAVALGQRQCDSDVTLKAFLSRRQADALQSKHRDSG